MQELRSVHPFQRAPHATLVRLALPVLISLAAEPVTGAVDTAFVARLGAPSLAALLFQPINAFAFATDGIHWGTGDFRYLRNAMLGASAAAPWPLKSVLGMTGDRPAGVIFSPGTGGSTSIKIHDRQSFTGRKTP